jgi:hypothetical protein
MYGFVLLILFGSYELTLVARLPRLDWFLYLGLYTILVTRC